MCENLSLERGEGQRHAYWSRLGLLYGANMFQDRNSCALLQLIEAGFEYVNDEYDDGRQAI